MPYFPSPQYEAWLTDPRVHTPEQAALADPFNTGFGLGSRGRRERDRFREQTWSPSAIEAVGGTRPEIQMGGGGGGFTPSRPSQPSQPAPRSTSTIMATVPARRRESLAPAGLGNSAPMNDTLGFSPFAIENDPLGRTIGDAIGLGEDPTGFEEMSQPRLGALQDEMRNAPPMGEFYGSESYADPEQWRLENVTNLWSEDVPPMTRGPMRDAAAFEPGPMLPWALTDNSPRQGDQIGGRGARIPFDQPFDGGVYWDESLGADEFAAAEIAPGPEGDARRAAIDEADDLRRYDDALADMAEFGSGARPKPKAFAAAAAKAKGLETRIGQSGKTDKMALEMYRQGAMTDRQNDAIESREKLAEANQKLQQDKIRLDEEWRNGRLRREDAGIFISGIDAAIEANNTAIKNTYDPDTKAFLTMKNGEEMRKRQAVTETFAPGAAPKQSPSASSPDESPGQAMARIAREKFGATKPGDLTPEQQQQVRDAYAASRK